MSEGDKEYNDGGGGGLTKAQGIYDDDGKNSSSGYWEGVGRTVLPPALAGFSFSLSSSFVVAVFSVVVVFFINPPLLIVLPRGFLIVLLVSLASSTIRAEGTTNVSYRIIIRLFLSRDYLLVFFVARIHCDISYIYNLLFCTDISDCYVTI